jgi:tetratricopeptide (TPR) repeat protein
MEEQIQAQLQLLEQLLNAEPAARERLLQQYAPILPQLALFAEWVAQNQPEVAPYLLPLAQEMKARVTLPPMSGSAIKLTVAQTPTAAPSQAEAKVAPSEPVSAVGDGELQMTTISRSQPAIDESRIGTLNRPPEPMPRLLRLTVAGQKVRLADGANSVEADFTLPKPEKVARAQELMKKARLKIAAEDKELKELGSHFYEHLLPGAVSAAFEAVWRERKPLQLHLELSEPKVQAVPWEYLAKDDDFLAHKPFFALSRHVEGAYNRFDEEKLALPLRLLVVVSSPLDLELESQLDADREVTLIRRGTKKLVDAGDLEIEVEDIVSLTQLEATLQEYKPHLVHFTGHGFIEKNEAGNITGSGLLLENDKGNKTLVTAAQLADVFENCPSVRAVVLSACVTALAGTNQIIESTAAQLVKAGIPAVIAMQESIRDDSATLFAQHFYPALAERQPIGKALANARRALSRLDRGEGKNSDWGMPVLLTGQPDLNPFVFDKRDTPRPLAWQSGAGLSAVSGTQGYFVGRQIEQRKLREVLTGDKAKLAIVYGLGGFGKSTLAQRMIERTLTRFKLVHTISCKSWQGLDFAMSGLADAFAGVGYPRLKELLADKERRFTPEEYGQEVVKGLNELPALLVLDNFEDLLPWQDLAEAANATLKPSDAAVSEWLEAMLLTPGKGRILVTSRYNFVFTRTERHSQAIERIALDRLGYVEAIRLMGEYSQLAKVPIEERLELWKQGIDSPQVIEWADAQRRQVGGLERQNTLLALHGKFTSEMLLADLYAGLPANAKVLMRRMAVYREALPLEFLNRQLKGAKTALSTLQDRQLLWVSQIRDARGNPTSLYSQHQSVRLFGLERLEKEEEKEGLWQAHGRAALHYEYYADQTSHNLPDYIAAKDHFIAAQQLKEAVRLVRALNPALERQGYWREGLKLNRELNDLWRGGATASATTPPAEVDLNDQADLLKNEADRMRDLGEVAAAIPLYEAALALAQQAHNRQGEGAILGNLGNAYDSLGQYERAIEFHQQNLQIAKEIGDRRGQGAAYGNLGIAYASLGQYERAIEFHQQTLQIAKEIGDRQGQGAAYGNLGIAYASLGQYERAIEFHQQHLQIAIEIGDRSGQGNAYGNLGNAYDSLGQYERAIEFQEQRLQIAIEIGDRRGQGNAYGNLGNAYDSLGQYERAIEFHQQNLQIAIEIGDRRGQGATYGNLGNAYDSLGQYERAIEFQEQYLQIAIEIGDRRGQGNAYGNLGNAYDSLGQYERAIEFLQQTLQIAIEIGDRRGQGATYGNLGIAYDSLGQYERAIEFLQQHLQIAIEIGDRSGQGAAYGNLGIAYLSLGRYEEGVGSGVEGLLILLQIKSPNARQVFNLLGRLRRKAGLDRFEELVAQTCAKLGVAYHQFRPLLDQNGVFSDTAALNLHQKSLAYAFAHAGLGEEQAVNEVKSWLEQNRQSNQWANLAAVVERLLAGERSPQVLLAPANALDEIDQIILEATLAAIADPARLSALQAELEAESGQGTPQAPQLDEQQRQIAVALGLALQGQSAARQFIEDKVIPTYASEQSQYKALAAVMRGLLAGEDVETVLNAHGSELDAVDRAMLQLALSVAAGKTDVENGAEASATNLVQPSPEAQVAQIIGMLVLAAQGNSQAQAVAKQFIEGLQGQVETRRGSA